MHAAQQAADGRELLPIGRLQPIALAREREIVPAWVLQGFGFCVLLLTGFAEFVRLTRFPS